MGGWGRREGWGLPEGFINGKINQLLLSMSSNSTSENIVCFCYCQTANDNFCVFSEIDQM